MAVKSESKKREKRKKGGREKGEISE